MKVNWYDNIKNNLKKFPQGITAKNLFDEMVKNGFVCEGDGLNSLIAILNHNGDKTKYSYDLWKELIGHIQKNGTGNSALYYWK